MASISVEKKILAVMRWNSAMPELEASIKLQRNLEDIATHCRNGC